MPGELVRFSGGPISRGAWIVLVLIVCVMAGACSVPPLQPPPSADPVAPQPSTGGEPSDRCPAVAPGASTAIVDYVDFIRFGHTTYLAGLETVPRAEKPDLGEVVMISRCSFSRLNERTHRVTPAPSDGDTGYLPSGTPVYALQGWSPSCRLAAEHGGRLHVYLAQESGGTEARPAECALR